MERNFSARILLKNICNSLEVFEESVIIIKANSVDEIPEKVKSYVDTLNGDNGDNKILELVSIIDYFEVEDKVEIQNKFVDIYSRYLDEEEMELYKL